MQFDIKELISQYGYLALLIGCISEGETFTLLGGIAVHEGLLKFNGVVLTTMIGGIIGDQALFYIGYYLGTNILKRFNKYKQTINKVDQLIKKWPSLFVISVRFMYGFRIIGPIIIGISRLNPIRFFILNIIGAALWSVIFVTLGYFAGEIITIWLHNLNKHLKLLIYLVLISFLVIYIIYYWNRHKTN
ncbi:DedA family protein [Pantoea sp. Aalb]|uniref:DedA family protein n=1 Tax=Pantoea sp. Aalb TaxID=2576762 RepID=UPI00132A68F7|nr:DedA family protein [Pantoea sp. Aalb]MXP67516.1 DedA family protein [Pantoea sp. Aalb]